MGVTAQRSDAVPKVCCGTGCLVVTRPSASEPLIRVLRMSIWVNCESTNFDRVHRIIGGPWPSTKTGPPVVAERLLDSGLIVHDERPVLSDRLTDRPSLQKQDLRAFTPGGDLERSI